MSVGLLTLLLNLAVTVTQPQSPTLRQVLEKHAVPADEVEDTDRRITSFAVDSDPRGFAIAYYLYQGNDRLPPELRVRTFDRKTRDSRSTVLPYDAYQGGSATGIARKHGWIYIDTHINPSAGALLILSTDLRLKKRLYGWTSLLLPDGRVVYENSMVHFAPVHPGSVSLYDPETDRDLRLYPKKPDGAGPVLQDRDIVNVTLVGRSRLRIEVREQDMTVTPDNRSKANGPERRFDVICDVATRTPTCRVR